MPRLEALHLTLVPVASRPGVYDAVLRSTRAEHSPCGTPIARSRQPFLDAARALLAQGYDGGTTLTASHKGSAIVAQRSTIGEAARWTIEETDRGGLRKRLWRPSPRGLLTVPDNLRAIASAA